MTRIRNAIVAAFYGIEKPVAWLVCIAICLLFWSIVIRTVVHALVSLLQQR